jgi:hypothetical protein
MTDYSTAFLAQLPKQGEMQIDNPSLPLQVIYSVLEHPVTGEEQRRREKTAGRLLSLVRGLFLPCYASNGIVDQYRQPPYWPLFRLTPESLTKLTQVISFSPIPKSIFGHLLVHAIEDLAGIRGEKAIERRRVGGSGDFVEGGGWFSRPTIGYTLDLLLLPPSNGDGEEDVEEKMGILKLVLISTMIQTTLLSAFRGDGKDEEWTKSQEPEYRGNLISRFSGRGVGVDGMREVLVMVLDRQCTRNQGEDE